MDTSEHSEFANLVRFCAQNLARDGVRALGGLYDVTASRLIRYAAALTRRRDDAEDALQAALVRIALRPRVLAEARYPWAYLLKMIRNEALNILRRRRPMRSLSPQSQHWLEYPPVWGADDLHHMVRAAIQKLPPAQAEVVVLKVWEEMTFTEIGEVLGQSPNTAASRYRYALQKLSHHLQAVEQELHDG